MFWLSVGSVLGAILFAGWRVDQRRKRSPYVHGSHAGGGDPSVGAMYFQAMQGPGGHDPYTAASLDRKKSTD
ncbi:hypothetical protein EXE58_07965 [Nocardioides seonyuensis]|uniref:Uncharacterized protein n=1 Tax=Nocardioides seonyuensis TaxID=2518371 RepID=A0A4P7IDW5_9ACTN|nr:hypothetical protein [Nocardioides seonyuensis]QBX55395.1 hypothetical protein EXE58_07965 [Nocardioides seonyuensis]